MSENQTRIVCSQCGRELAERRNFCPFCGNAIQAPPAKAVSPPVPLTWTPAPEPAGPRRETDRPARPGIPRKPYQTARRFRIVDLRVLLGILGLVDIPIIVALVLLLMGNPFSKPKLTTCDQLNQDEFTLTKYQVGLGGELDQDTLFQADAEYVIQDVLVVPQGLRLLVEPGVRLVFEPGAGLEVHGGLYVCGSGKKPVTFTAEEGEPGGWEGIRFLNADEDSTLSHVLVLFAGDRAIYLENSAPKLLDVKIANGSGFPISSDGNSLPDLLGDVNLDDNPFKGIEIRSGTLGDESIEWPNHGLAYIVSGPFEVGVNTTLTIGPEAVVKFWHAPRGDMPGLRVRGLLKAEGVRFTSVHDSGEEVGGVTYLEAEDPQPGDWAGITFQESSSKCTLRRVWVRYAGQGQGAISMQASSPELTEVTIADSAWYPLSADAGSFPTLENLTLTDNDPGDALEIRGGSAITGRQQVAWKLLGGKTQLVRVIRGEVTVDTEATLTIEPGVVIKFEKESRLVVKGTLRAIGGDQEAERIVFTSLRDDDYGGQTDKTTGPQDVRKWDGIVLEKTDGSSVLENCIIRYGSIALNDASPRLVGNLIQDSETAAIWASPMADPEMRDNRLERNQTDGIAIWKATISDDRTWAPIGTGETQLVRVLAGEVTVAEGATLRIEQGTIVKANGDGRLKVLGSLRVMGQSGQPVVFTSLQDDSAGGDTNRKLQEAEAGDWPGIEVSPAADVRFAYTVIRYAENGLILRGDTVLAFEGWLRVSDGKRALWCDGTAQMPAAFQAEGNDVNETKCPSQ